MRNCTLKIKEKSEDDNNNEGIEWKVLSLYVHVIYILYRKLENGAQMFKKKEENWTQREKIVFSYSQSVSYFVPNRTGSPYVTDWFEDLFVNWNEIEINAKIYLNKDTKRIVLTLDDGY